LLVEVMFETRRQVHVKHEFYDAVL
jgi:hypothetical protein